MLVFLVLILLKVPLPDCMVETKHVQITAGEHAKQWAVLVGPGKHKLNDALRRQRKLQKPKANEFPGVTTLHRMAIEEEIDALFQQKRAVRASSEAVLVGAAAAAGGRRRQSRRR